MQRPINRIDPQAGPEVFKTYRLSAPIATHRRPATCAEVECGNWQHGFRTTIDVSTPLGREQASYIEHKAGRHFTREVNGSLVAYTFRPGQSCFRAHTVPIGREPTYLIEGGDYRGNPLGTRTQMVSERSWIDDFGENQENVATRQQRG